MSQRLPLISALHMLPSWLTIELVTVLLVPPTSDECVELVTLEPSEDVIELETFPEFIELETFDEVLELTEFETFEDVLEWTVLAAPAKGTFPPTPYTHKPSATTAARYLVFMLFTPGAAVPAQLKR